jgi:S-adenosylmethionine uptake transporter
MPTQQQNIVLGVLWILLNHLVICLQTATIKGLSQTMHSFQVIFLYKLAVLVMVMFVVARHGIKSLKTKKLHLHFLRAFLSISAATAFVYGLKHIPLANAMAISFTEPLFATILAVVLLHEKLSRYCVIALVIGFVGTMIVLRPNATDFNVHTLYILLAALIWSLDNIVIKLLGRTESSVQYLFYISFFSTIFSMPLAIQKWQTPEVWQAPWIMALAVFYFIHLMAVFKAFQYAHISNLAPFDFSKLVVSTLLGYVIFGEAVALRVVIGSVLIISSTVYIIWHKERGKIRARFKAKFSSFNKNNETKTNPSTP